MPGFYGYVKDHHSNNEIENMTNALMHQSSFISEEHVSDDRLQFCHIHLDKAKSTKKVFYKKGVFITVEGEQYDFPGEALELLIFKWYSEQRLDQELNKLDGYFNALIYDTNSNKLSLISDRYGMRMLYYYFKAGRFAWSCEVKGLLALSFLDQTIDQSSFDSFIQLGHVIGDKTWFEEIKLIAPSTILEFDLNTGCCYPRHYWSWAEIKPQVISFDDAVKALGNLFLQAVEKRFSDDEKVGIALSGGLDSRAIFAAVNRLYPNYNGYAFTFGVADCDDIEIAKMVANRTEWKHKIYNFSDHNWFKPRIEKIWQTDGMLDMMHMHGSEFLDDIADQIQVNLNGYAGDVICGGGWINDNIKDQPANGSNLASFYKDFSDTFDYQDDFYAIDKCDPHLLMNKVRRFTNMGSVNNLCKLAQRKPFLDNDLIEFIYSIPDEYRANNRLYSAMLLMFFPEFYDDIPWQQTRQTLTGKLSNKINRDIVIRSYMNYAGAIREPEILKQLYSILQFDKSEYKKYTNIDAVEEYLQPHIDSIGCNRINQIFRIATVENYFKKLSQLH